MFIIHLCIIFNYYYLTLFPDSVTVKSHAVIPPSVGQLGDQEGEKLSAKDILAAGGN